MGQVNWTEHGWVYAIVTDDGHLYADAASTDDGHEQDQIRVKFVFSCRHRI
jgi:hypothetical protein